MSCACNNICNRTFFGKNCFEEHLRDRSKGERRSVVCELVQKCTKCHRTVGDLKKHVCGHAMCSNCKSDCHPQTYKCYMLPVEAKGGACTRDTPCTRPKRSWCLCCKTRTTRYMFYDLETQQDTGTHLVNYVNAQDFEGNELTFGTIDEFCKFVFSKQHDGYTFIAHNAKSFDAVFVLRYCIDNAIKPFCIYNGTKIMYMAVEKYNVQFVDSINFVNAALETFPKTFGFSELKKGYFSHLVNTPENQAYVGSIPPKYYYDPGHMTPSKRNAFLTWYDECVAENYVFNFKNELQLYCRSDVDFLPGGMMLFRENFLIIANIDPLQYVTIASVCMAVYRSKYMPKDTIGIIKDVPKNTFSQTSIHWLRWRSEIDNVYIQHAMNGGEHFIPTVGKVDGFCKKTNTVYQFQGCFWHGCSRCYTGDRINPVNQRDMLELQRTTERKNQGIRDLGYTLVEVYQCELRKDVEFKKWCKNNTVGIVTLLNPRDALYGGRTNVTKLTYEFKENEYGRYLDFVSLYPTLIFSKNILSGIL